MLISVQVKMEPEEREQLRHDAHQHAMNVSEYVRWLIQQERKNIK